VFIPISFKPLTGILLFVPIMIQKWSHAYPYLLVGVARAENTCAPAMVRASG
jgi:hypothetical protein